MSAAFTAPTPHNADSDSLDDKQELTQHASNPLQSDADNDGINDGTKSVFLGYKPANNDTGTDWVENGDEVQAGTNTLIAYAYSGISVVTFCKV